MIWLTSPLFYPYTTLPPQSRVSEFWWCALASGFVLALGQTFYSLSFMHTNNFGVMSMLGFVGVGLSYFIKIVRYH